MDNNRPSAIQLTYTHLLSKKEEARLVRRESKHDEVCVEAVQDVG